MKYVCVTCERELEVIASVSKPRAVCVCEPCVRKDINPEELRAKLNPKEKRDESG